ncbi:T9SS type A sorting domain-containing protein [Hymenobacter sp.]|uniref:T9SS type A sorting domain-containing protein n=1 Tax=Hymenobacter sp. TaxID=1898978 RepID=UPI00286CA5F9|nr:T9SS type A sorting domain-containing protein [Hymenobacter sp.]
MTIIGIGTVIREFGVQFPERAADVNLNDFAIINSAIGIGSTETLRLGLGGSGGVAGYRAGMLVSSPVTNRNLANFNALGAIRLVTYNGGVQQETQTVSAEVAKDLLEGEGRPTQVEFVASRPFNSIQIEVDGVLMVSYKIQVHYAYAVPSLIQPQARGVLSRFAGAGADLAPYYGAGTSNAGVVSACVNAGIQNPENAVDNDLTNFARFNNLATVSCPAALSVKLEGGRPAPGGYYAGFVIGDDQLLDASVLSGLRVSTFRNGVATGESATGAGVLELRVLPDGKSQVSFPTTLPFDEVRIERIGLVTVLDDLKLFYGFGVEPRAFLGTTQVLSDFAPNQPVDQFKVDNNSALCLSLGNPCGVTNPQGAADKDPNTFAVLNVPVGALPNVELKLNLNGVGMAGNRAGMVIGDGRSLLDARVLDQLTITTYDEFGNVLESASGNSALALNLLPDGRQELSFLTTRPFTSVQLTAASGAAAFNNIPIHFAFADDRTGGLPSVITPLPVELVAFAGRWANGASELTWATASEKNSSHFVVERSTGGDAAFRSVGRIAAAGSTSNSQNYRFRDAEAGTQGVAVLYYRLRQVDVDGKEAFSPVAAVAIAKLAVAAPQIEVYPNPAAEAQAVMVRCLNLPANGGTVQTYSQLGQLVSQLPLTAAALLTLPTLAPGLYHVVLRNATGQQLATQRLVVGGR